MSLLSSLLDPAATGSTSSLDTKNSTKYATDNNANWNTSASSDFNTSSLDLTITGLTAGSSLGLIDGQEPTLETRIFIKDMDTISNALTDGGAEGAPKKYNGIWVVKSGTTTSLVLRRSLDYNSTETLLPSSFLFVEEGTVADELFVLTTDAPIVVNTTELDYQNIGSAGTIDHNSTTGIQGGSISERYHLSQAEHTNATQNATGSLTGLLSSTDWTTFNNKQNALTNGADNLTTGEVTQLANIDATTISTTQWGYLGALDQGLTTSSDVQFNTLGAGGAPGSEALTLFGDTNLTNDGAKTVGFFDSPASGNGSDLTIHGATGEFNVGNAGNLTIQAGTVRTIAAALNAGDLILRSGKEGNITGFNSIYGDIILETGGQDTYNEVMRLVGATQRVGIGLSTPLSQLHIQQGVPVGAAAPNANQDVIVCDADNSAFINLRSPNVGAVSQTGFLFSDDLRASGEMTYVHREASVDADYWHMTVLGNRGIKIDSSGHCSHPSQAAFLAQRSASIGSVTGDGTSYTVVFNSEVFDTGADFNTSTGVFTAPITGQYLLNFHVNLSGVSTLNTLAVAKIVTSNRTYRTWDTAAADVQRSGTMTMQGSMLVDMDAGDTASILIIVSGSTKTVGVGGGTEFSYFSGSLIN